RNLVEHLAAREGWDVIALSRRAPNFETPARYVSVDLLDADHTRRQLAGLGGVTHVFHAAYQEKGDPAQQVRVNLDLLRNLVEAAEQAAPGLRRVVLCEGVKDYGVHCSLRHRRMKARN